jgi:hypothetical protein
MLGRKVKDVKTIDMEIELARYFNPRINIIVPNVWWGMGINHECDMMVMTPSGYAYEIEIKVNKYDLIRDKDKPHGHSSRKIKRLYFAIPEELEPYIDNIPDHSGILIVRANNFRSVKKIRESKIINNYKYSDGEMFALAKLGTMRIFGLKEKINSNLKTETTAKALSH